MTKDRRRAGDMRSFASQLLPSSGPSAYPHSVFRLLAFRSLRFFPSSTASHLHSFVLPRLHSSHFASPTISKLCSFVFLHSFATPLLRSSTPLFSYSRTPPTFPALLRVFSLPSAVPLTIPASNASSFLPPHLQPQQL
jgi:hypothetical protein